MSGLLAFHAHPDDESISMGATLAEVASRGVAVTVVTATRGEVGEIHNRDDADEIRPRLGEVREQEERDALAVLGIEDLEYLGYRDSGMMGEDDNRVAGSFWQADLMDSVGRLVRIIRDRKPRVMTAYDPFGGYGHPDHIQVHRVGTAAFFAASDIGRFSAGEFGDPWAPERLLWTTWSRDRTRALRREMGVDSDEEPSSGFMSSFIAVSRDVSAFADHKRRALLSHVTQFSPDSWVRTLPEPLLLRYLGTESFIPVWGGDTDPFPEL